MRLGSQINRHTFSCFIGSILVGLLLTVGSSKLNAASGYYYMMTTKAERNRGNCLEANETSGWAYFARCNRSNSRQLWTNRRPVSGSGDITLMTKASQRSGKCLGFYTVIVENRQKKLPKLAHCDGSIRQLWTSMSISRDGQNYLVNKQYANGQFYNWRCWNGSNSAHANNTALQPCRGNNSGIVWQNISVQQHQQTGQTCNIGNAPIWNQNDAQNKCPNRCRSAGGASWTGQWRTVIQGRASVCECNNVPSHAMGQCR